MKHSKQYTIRGITLELDKQLKKIAHHKGQSLNTWIVMLLSKSCGLEEEAPVYHDLDSLCGQWVEDKEVMKALAEQRKIDEEMWK